jgi:HJR/Mrr/RecB family endonuclease
MSTEKYDRASILRWIAQYYAPETCAAIDFQMFTHYVGDQLRAERLIKELIGEGLINALSSETKPSGGITTGGAASTNGPIKLSNRFVISEKGLTTVEVLFDPARSSSEVSSKQSTVDSRKSAEIVKVSTWINDQLMKELQRDPGRMLSQKPREFEQLVAEIYQREGFTVELTPPSRDGGRDVIAVTHSHLGTQRYLAECKRYDSKNHVGVELVRSLYGVMEAERATYAVLATTSSFTTGAKEFAQEIRWRLGLKDYEELKNCFHNSRADRIFIHTS